MKFGVFYMFFLFTISYQQSLPDTIKELLEQIREAIPEVIEIATLNVELPDNQYLTGTFNASNVNLKGIKEFDMDISYALIVIRRSFVFTLNTVNLDLDFISDLALFNSPLLTIFGTGNGSVSLNNFTLQAYLKVDLSPINLTITDMQMHLDDSEFTFNGLLDDETFSQQISDLLTDSFADIFNEKEYIISNAIQDTINSVIADIISGNSTSSEIYDEEDAEYDYHYDDYNLETVASERTIQEVTNILQQLFIVLTEIITKNMHMN